ncbi:hypothetical protein [Acidaminococcus sp.]|uniref:hypothetical protein n=1 Tax=Acidaminococcus sp. TaxID=1872103 RepID=UPI0035218355
MVRASFQAEGVSRKLKDGSQKMQRELRVAMKISVRDVQEEARSTHDFTSQSGAAEGSIHVRTTGSGSKVQGKVFTVLPYAVCLHEGTKAHTILPKKKKVLRWSDDGQFVFSKRSQVSGIKKDPFIYNALEKERPAIVSRFKKITDTLGG